MNLENREHIRQAAVLEQLARAKNQLDPSYIPSKPRLTKFGFRVPDENDIWLQGKHYCKVICLANERSRREPIDVVFQLTETGDVASIPIDIFLTHFEFVNESSSAASFVVSKQPLTKVSYDAPA